MNSIKNEIIRAAKSLNINVSLIEPLQAKKIINKIYLKYANGKKSKFLWEDFVGQIGVNDKDAWKWVKEFIRNNETIMFFNPTDEAFAFRFSNGKDIESILGETFGFEFYLTDKRYDYVLCFNHHDFLIACGSAVPWLKQY